MRPFTLLRLVLVVCLTTITASTLWAAPTPADKSFEAAAQFLRIGNDRQAIAELQRFITMYPNDTRVAQVYFWLGFSNQKLQKLPQAIEAYTHVVAKTALDDSDEVVELRAKTHFQLGDCYMAQKDYEKSARSYGNFIQLSSRINLTARDAEFQKSWQSCIINAQYRKAESLYQLVREQDALNEYAKVLTLAPNDPLAAWASYRMGTIELTRMHYTEAITAFERVTTRYATSEVAGEATFELGMAYAGRFHEQKEAAAKAADAKQATDILTAVLGKDNVTTKAKQQACLALAGIYYAQNDATHAAASYKRALEYMDPGSREETAIRLQCAHILYNATQYDGANAEYRIVSQQKKFPDLATEAIYWLANSEYQLATATKDQQAYRRAIAALDAFLTPPGDKDPRAAAACLLLAYCHEDLANAGEKGAEDLATTAFSRILRQWPTSDQAGQARAGMSRLSRVLTPERLRSLVGTLPPGAASWDVALQLAYKEFNAGHYDSAITSARRVLEGKPSADVRAQAAYLVGTSWQKLNRPKDAIPYYQQVLDGVDDGELAPFAQRGLVQAYLDTRDFANARDAALALLKMPAQGEGEAEIAANQVERLVFLASAYMGTQQLSEARDTYRKVVTDYPKSPLASTALMNIAWIAETNKDGNAAIAAYQEFLAKYPDHEQVPDAFFQLGVNLVKKGDYDKAINAFNNVTKSSKLADQAAYAIAWAYTDQKKTDEAAKAFTALTENFPTSPLATDSWYRLGEFAFEKKDYAEAMRYFSRALDLNQDATLGALIAYKLGTSAFQANQYTLAANAFGKLAANYPNNEYATDSLFWKAQSLEKAGPAQAIAAHDAYLQYLTKAPTGEFAADAAVGAARASMAGKQYATARTDLQKAVEVCGKLEKNDNAKLAERARSLGGEIQFTLAQSYFEEKNYDQAQREFASVSIFKYEPWYSRSYLQLARCNALLNDKDNAINTLKLLIRIAPDSEAAKQIPDVAKELGLQL